jgi:hypothetical protein
MPSTTDAFLTSLEAAKSRFGQGEATQVKRLLDQLANRELGDTKSLLRFHETLLFLRAFPHSPALVRQIEILLNTFHCRIEKLRALGTDMEAFDDFDTAGIAGTTMQDVLNFEAARWLARRIPRNVEIAWDDYWDDDYAERAMASTWPRFIPLLEEDSSVEANIPWRRWFNAARGRERGLEWLISRFEQLPVAEAQQESARAEIYDSLRLPLRWHLKNLKLSRTRNWTRPRHFYYHAEPLITRSQVSLARELAPPAPRLTRLSRREGERILNTIREVMLVRYRELYGTTLGDPSSVVCAELARGVAMYFWNLPNTRRLPLRAYVAGFTLKNGVPINYIEAIGLCEWIEVGFNTFYTYRGGETAWIYAQSLRCLRALTGATTVSIYPYQIGQNNDEALDSGAFWFYRKLGFRSGRQDLEQLARREEQKIAADPRHRTSKRILKQLAEAHMFYELDRASESDRVGLGRGETQVGPDETQIGKGTSSTRAANAANSASALAAEGMSGPWDTFSTRNIALRVNRRMALEFAGDSARIRRASVAEVSRALEVNLSRWNSVQREAFENWSLVLALIPDLRRWSPKEKTASAEIIRSQAAWNEMRYLRLTQRHSRLREELLRLGS